MPEDAAKLLTHALKLPPAARAALADSLIDSLDTEVDENAEKAWRHEIALRVRALDSGAVHTIAWDEGCRYLRSRFNGYCEGLSPETELRHERSARRTRWRLLPRPAPLLKEF
jgi:putative addiction module component (TIGR02574 family)